MPAAEMLNQILFTYLIEGQSAGDLKFELGVFDFGHDAGLTAAEMDAIGTLALLAGEVDERLRPESELRDVVLHHLVEANLLPDFFTGADIVEVFSPSHLIAANLLPDWVSLSSTPGDSSTSQTICRKDRVDATEPSPNRVIFDLSDWVTEAHVGDPEPFIGPASQPGEQLAGKSPQVVLS